MSRRYGKAKLRFLIAGAALLALSCPGMAARSSLPGKPPKPAPLPGRRGRDMQVIDDRWRLRADPERRGEANGWERAMPSGTEEAPVPGLWGKSTGAFAAGVAWYWRAVEAPASWKGQTVRLRFEAVAERAAVWLNGERLGEHNGGATPFEFNITKPLHIGQENLLAVRVEGDPKAGAGIWQGVLLMAHDEAYIADVFPQGSGLGRLTVPIALLNTSTNTGDATLSARIVAADTPERDIKKTEQNLHLTPDRNLTTLLVSVRGKNLSLWSPTTPSLYALQLAFRQQNDILDTQQTIFGFREFGFKDGRMTLNGEALTLNAIAPNPDLPVVIATTEDVDRARDSLRRIKQAGVDVVHLNAPPPRLLQLADEEGLLVVEGARPTLASQAAGEEMRALVLRDRAHPCLLAWNLGAADSDAAKSIRRLDPTRFLLVGPSSSPQLWLPGQMTSSPEAPPPGLLPKI
jgi:beta-galactosidase